MNNLTKTIIACGIVLIVGIVIGGAGKVPADLGATVYNRMISFDEGIAVDGTEVISGTGGVSFTTGAFSSTLTVSDVLTVDSIKYGGSGVLSFSLTKATSSAETMTAAQLCDYPVIDLSHATATLTLTFPTATSIIADCMSTAGEIIELLIRNTSGSGSSTVLTAGNGFTFQYPSASSSATVVGGQDVLIKMIAASTTAIDALITRVK